MYLNEKLYCLECNKSVAILHYIYLHSYKPGMFGLQIFLFHCYISIKKKKKKINKILKSTSKKEAISGEKNFIKRLKISFKKCLTKNRL